MSDDPDVIRNGLLVPPAPREKYESPKDREHQYEIAALIGAKWKCKMHELPHSYEIDFCATRDDGNEIVAMIETKHRTHTIDEYPDVMLSLRKWRAMKSYEALGVPCILAFRFNDTIWYLRVGADLQYKALLAGRTRQTRDPADVEPCVYIPIAVWKKL